MPTERQNEKRNSSFMTITRFKEKRYSGINPNPRPTDLRKW